VLPRLVVSPRERRPASCSRPFSLSGSTVAVAFYAQSDHDQACTNQNIHFSRASFVSTGTATATGIHFDSDMPTVSELPASNGTYYAAGFQGMAVAPPAACCTSTRSTAAPATPFSFSHARTAGVGARVALVEAPAARVAAAAVSLLVSSAPRWRANLGPWPHRLRCSQPRPGEAARSSQLEYWRHLSGRRERQVHYQDQALCGLQHDCQKDQIKAGAAARQWDRGPAPRDAWPHQDSTSRSPASAPSARDGA